MIYDGIEYFPVTEDAKILEQLRLREDMDSRKLGEYAFSLGLRPPNHTDGDQIPEVVHVFPPDDDEGVLVWDIFEDEDHGDEEYGINTLGFARR